MGLVIGFATLFAIGAAVMGCMWLLGANVAPAEKRTYLFETEDGERYNPFATEHDRPAEPSDGSAECWSCGEHTETEYAFCGACGTRQL